ncbi:MAG: hypothetical protein ACD_46C00241G0002, partial [uncultured bacterium]
LTNIKDYGARAVALFLGSDQLKTEDLIDVLEQSTIFFYKSLLQAVNSRHGEFGVCCALIMRYSAKIEKVIHADNIHTYLDVCAALIKKYGTKIAEHYIRASHDFIAVVPLEDHIRVIEDLSKKSISYVEFYLMHFKIVHVSPQPATECCDDFKQYKAADIKKIKIRILQTNDYTAFLQNTYFHADKDFLSLMMHWPNLSEPIKENILFQLQQDNYRDFIIAHNDIQAERHHLNQVTHSNWLNTWTFCEEIVDLAFIRKSMGRMLQDKNKFSLPSKTIIKKYDATFDRLNTQYSHSRVLSMINILLTYCTDKASQDKLTAMADFILGNRYPLKSILSKKMVVVQTWERDPWLDYGRSDELFSCTSLGDYNAGNAPGFLADLNLNNLDIWNNGVRVGRIHLCLTKDEAGNAILLLDCVDGTERIIESQKKFEAIMNAVLAYARWLGIQKIKINYDIDYNATPKKFISYVERLFQEENRIDFLSRFLTLSTTSKLIPYPCQTFTESFLKNNGAFVRGALIKNDRTLI